MSSGNPLCTHNFHWKQESFNVQDESFHKKYAHVGQQTEKQNTVKII